MEKWINELIVAAIASFFMVVGWFVRTVLTNSRKIALLEDEIQERDRRRDEDRQTLLEMRRDIKQDFKDIREEVHRLVSYNK